MIYKAMKQLFLQNEGRIEHIVACASDQGQNLVKACELLNVSHMKCTPHYLNLAVSSVCEVGLPGKQGKKKSENRIWRRWCIISTPQAIHSLPTENGDSVDWEMEMSQSYSQKNELVDDTDDVIELNQKHEE